MYLDWSKFIFKKKTLYYFYGLFKSVCNLLIRYVIAFELVSTKF